MKEKYDDNQPMSRQFVNNGMMMMTTERKKCSHLSCPDGNGDCGIVEILIAHLMDTSCHVRNLREILETRRNTDIWIRALWALASGQR